MLVSRAFLRCSHICLKDPLSCVCRPSSAHFGCFFSHRDEQQATFLEEAEEVTPVGNRLHNQVCHHEVVLARAWQAWVAPCDLHDSIGWAGKIPSSMALNLGDSLT